MGVQIKSDEEKEAAVKRLNGSSEVKIGRSISNAGVLSAMDSRII